MTLTHIRHFDLHPLATGVFAVIHKPGGWAIGNAGFIDLGDRTFVFDTTMTPDAADDLRREAERLTSGPIDFVLNSHYHNDHIWGNQVFDQASRVLSTHTTRTLIQTAGMDEIEWFAKVVEAQLRRIRGLVGSRAGEAMDLDMSSRLEYFQAIEATLPSLKVREPAVVFEEEMVIRGSEREVILKEFQNAHTGSDVVAFLPAEGIVFLSDLLFIGCHPFLADGDPGNLRRVLIELQTYKADVFVSGHGTIGTREDLVRMVDYVDLCYEAAESAKNLPEDEFDLDLCPVPQPFVDWSFSDFFLTNLKFILSLSNNIQETKEDD